MGKILFAEGNNIPDDILNSIRGLAGEYGRGY
jgi:hypothetical protein